MPKLMISVQRLQSLKSVINQARAKM